MSHIIWLATYRSLFLRTCAIPEIIRFNKLELRMVYLPIKAQNTSKNTTEWQEQKGRERSLSFNCPESKNNEQVLNSSWDGRPFGINRHRPKIGGLCPPPLFLGGENWLGPHVTQCGLGRGLPSHQVASRSIQPFGHNRHGLKIGGCTPFFGESWVPI